MGMQEGQPLQATDQQPMQPQQQMQQQPPVSDEDAETTEQEQKEREIDKILQSKNIAAKLDKELLQKIGADLKYQFEIDLDSRKEWENGVDEWTKMAMQARETKSFPWNKASNVKYPLISTSAMQFAARAYPSLVPSDGKVVKAIVIGNDPDGAKQDKADRVAMYMSYQVMHQLDNWEEDMDKLLMMLPIVGTVFKKTYYCTADENVKSYLISPKNLVVNYWARDLENAERVSEVIEMPKRIFVERKKQEIFLDVDLPDPTSNQFVTVPLTNYNVSDEAIPYTLIESHAYLDLDEDGYTEPYIVTFDRKSGTVVRIVARFTQDGIKTNEKGKITSIKPTQYYTKFSFVPNPDGSFYDIGFGTLLGPINEAINTHINQMTDAGTLANMQSGFIGKGLRLKMGDQRFTPGEWKPVNATADDLRKQIVPLPTKDPSDVLFKLMTALISSGKELASVAEIFTGKMPGQNTPATTTMATVEQGMKVFTAVYKRIFRSLSKEFKKIYELNETYLDPNTYVKILDSTIGPSDFNDEDYDVCPGADPNAVSSSEKMQKAQALLELLSTGILDPVEVIRRVLVAQEQPNYEKLFTQQVAQTGQPPQPKPDPKVMQLQMKGQMESQKLQMQSQMNQQKMELDSRDKQQQMEMAAQTHAMEMQSKQAQSQAQIAAEYHQNQARMAQAQAQHQQQLQQAHDTHQQKLQIAKETAKSLPNKNTPSGSHTR
jgi:chaperonin GroES